MTKKIAVPLAGGFEDSELTEPVDALIKAGHDVVIIGKKAGEQLRGKRGKATASTHRAAKDCSSEQFDAMMIPGGHSPDTLRTDDDVVNLVRGFMASNKPIAAVCHGPQLLIEADAVRGKQMTSWPSVKTDLVNAGANWMDAPVVEDGNLITSRNPDDLPAFSQALLDRL